MKYAQMIKLGKEKAAEFLAPLRAKEMKKEAELIICKIESDLASMEQCIEEECSKYPIDFDKVVDAIDEMKLTVMRKETLEKIVADRF